MLQQPDGTELRTEPDEFDPAFLKRELQKIAELTPKLDSYWQQEFRELPERLQQAVRTVAFLVQPITGGLERIDSVLWQLYTLQFLFEKLLKGESIRSFVAGSLDLPVGPLAPVHPKTQPVAAATVTLPNVGPDSAIQPTLSVEKATPSATLTMPTESPLHPTERAGTLVLPSDIDDAA